MCDTQIIRRDSIWYFAKNSDREPGEAQLVVRRPPVSGDKTASFKATYIEIDQVPDRHGVILSKPFWMWGAEMGANDRGVVIGNEAVFTRVMEKGNGLIGMDLLRLGLERGSTAAGALEVITRLLERYGQGGICGFRDQHMRYDNSFIIADPREAWVLETAGRHWAAKRVDGFAAISNCLTLGADYELKSDGLEDFAREKKLYSGKGDFSFKKAFDTAFLPFFAGAAKRLQASMTCLDRVRQSGAVSIGKMMEILRTHSCEGIAPASGSNKDICMHAGGFIRRSQTCGSMASRLAPGRGTHFFTGTSAPCLSLFKPADFEVDIAYCVFNQDGQTVEGSLWRRHEKIHRRLLFSHRERAEVKRSIADTEHRMLAVYEKAGFSPGAEETTEADALCRRWEEEAIARLAAHPIAYPFNLYGRFWKRANRQDGMD